MLEKCVTAAAVVIIISFQAVLSKEANETINYLQNFSEKTEEELEKTWFFSFDCSDRMEACRNLSNFEALCSRESRPNFETTNGLDAHGPLGASNFDLFGVFKFSTDNDFVGGIFAIGLLICLGIVIYKGFTLAEQHPILAKNLIDGCVECRTGKKPTTNNANEEVEMQSRNRKRCDE